MNLLAINLDATKTTPAVSADPSTGVFTMEGDSYPENSYEFFGPLIKWVESYLQQADAPLQLVLKIVYMNTSSVKAMMDIFDLLEELHTQGKRIHVSWSYDPRNERVVELIEEFKEDCTFPFDIVPDASPGRSAS
jgi:hypothetical protein